jgi:asparagine synthase (glutamine-hydrolysing)
MCGIAGIVSQAEIAPEVLQRMTQAIAHRGPDAEGFFEEGPVHLGHRRLSILDTSARGNQPMHDATGRYVLIHNGEIYNFRQVRQELGFAHGTETDTEVILAAYLRWGPACLSKFAGMWAFAIWDRVEATLFVARDRLGIKPIYYHFEEGRLIFASEIRALLRSGLFRPKVDRTGLASYLVYQTVYGNGTMLEGVQMVPPGHYGIWKDGNWTLTSWWDIWKNASMDAAEMDDSAVRKNIRRLLDQSIARRLVSDVPVGAFLSGGIDSSAIVALMAQASAQPVDTFSIVFEEKEYDESEWSGLIAKKFATRHHPILLKPSDFLEALPEALAAMDHPSADGINSYVVSQVTRAQGVKVALSGLGGDELFAGYPVFSQLPSIANSRLMHLPLGMRNLLANVYGSLKSGREAEKKTALLRLPSATIDDIYPIFRTVYDWPAAQNMLHLQAGTVHPLKNLLAHSQLERQKLPLLSQIGGLEINSYTQSVLLRDTDQMSMAHALEVRVPFFDHDLVEFAMGIPDAIKQPKRYPKQLLVESLGDLLPQGLVHRKKMGFVFPWEQWLRGELASFSHDRIHQFNARGLVANYEALPSIWHEFQAGRGPWLWPHIWLFVVLEEWLQRNGIES